VIGLLRILTHRPILHLLPRRQLHDPPTHPRQEGGREGGRTTEGVQSEVEEGESLGLGGIAIGKGLDSAGAEEAGDEGAKEGGGEGLGGGELVPGVVG